MKNKILKALPILFILALSFCLASCAAPVIDTATEQSVPDEKRIRLFGHGNTEFAIVTPSNSDRYYSFTAAGFRKRLADLSGVIFPIGSEEFSQTYEILIGATERKASRDAMESLPKYGYVIKVTEEKLVILGSSEVYTNEALYYLCDDLLKDPKYSSEGTVSLPVGLERIRSDEAPVKVDPAKALAAEKSVYASIHPVFEFAGKDGFHVSQGAATDGKYVYTVMKKSVDGTETDKVFKLDINSFEIIAKSDVLPLDHANDMTYDPVTRQLVVTNMKDNLLTFVNAETLAVTEIKRLDYGSYGIGYIHSLDRFAVLGYGSSAGLVIADRNFKPLFAKNLSSTPNFILMTREKPLEPRT